MKTMIDIRERIIEERGRQPREKRANRDCVAIDHKHILLLRHLLDKVLDG